MMVPFLCKLVRDRRGDTLVETLAALLIAVLGATLLATMVTTSAKVTASSEAELHEVYRAESTFDSGSTGSVDVVIRNAEMAVISKEIDVTVYKSEDASHPFYRYEYAGKSS